MRRTSAARRPGEAGLTLIELMIAMVISSILVALILGVHTRMTSAFRGQAKLAELGKTLRAARGRLISDLRQAGFMIPNGFQTAAFGTPDEIVPPVVIVNDASGDGPDAFTVHYADPSGAARVTAIDAATRQWVELSEAGGFVVGDRVVLTNPTFEDTGDTTSARTTYDACLVLVTAVDDSADPPRLEFTGEPGAAPFNTADNSHCAAVATATAAEGAASETAVFRLASRSYRISPDQLEVGLLQLSTTGGFVGDTWQDMAVGVINLQVATRFYEAADVVDLDFDGDAERDWYSGEGQEVDDPSGERPADAVALEVSLSLEVRTRYEVREVAAIASPALTDDSDPPESIQHNTMGDWASIDLAATADLDRPVAYRGKHLFRTATTAIDLRNVGVGR